MSKAKHKPYQWIDGETADRITSLNLKDYRAYLKKELKMWKANPKTEDSIRRIEALNLIIGDFITTEDTIK